MQVVSLKPCVMIYLSINYLVFPPPLFLLVSFSASSYSSSTVSSGLGLYKVKVNQKWFSSVRLDV